MLGRLGNCQKSGVANLRVPFAGGIGGAAPKLIAGVGTALRCAEHHWLAATRAGGVCTHYGRWRGGGGGLVLNRLDEGEELRAVNQADGFQGTKMPAVTYTQRPFEATQTPAYRFALASGEFNVAVYLGQCLAGCARWTSTKTRIWRRSSPSIRRWRRRRARAAVAAAWSGCAWPASFPRAAPRNILSGARMAGFRRFTAGIRRATGATRPASPGVTTITIRIGSASPMPNWNAAIRNDRVDARKARPQA